MAAGTMQMLMIASLKSTAFPASPQPSDSLFIFLFFIPALLESEAEMLKANRQIEEVNFSSAPGDVTWRLTFHVCKLSKQLHMEPSYLVIYLRDSGWPRGTVGKQLSSPIIREGKANTNTPRLTFKTKWRFNHDCSLYHPSSCLPICQEETRAKKEVLSIIYQCCSRGKSTNLGRRMKT